VEDFWLWFLLGVGPLVKAEGPRPTTSGPTEPSAAPPNVEAAVERLRRLVALSGSDNVHEARSAADQVARMLREKGLVETLAEHMRAAGRVARAGSIDAVVVPLLAAAPAERTRTAIIAAAALGKPFLPAAPSTGRFLRLRSPIEVTVTQKKHVDGRIVLTAIVVGGIAFALGWSLK